MTKWGVVKLGLLRNDFMLHAVSGQPIELRQVEINTISASFAMLSGRISALHRTLVAQQSIDSTLVSTALPLNPTHTSIPRLFKAALDLYSLLTLS